LPKNVTLLVEAGQSVPRRNNLEALARKVVRSERLKGQINLVFCSNAKVRALNREYRGLDRVTDVLSFFWDEPDFAGEIYIAAKQVKMQAPRWKNSYFNELRRVLVHGILHLCGYDHMKTKEREIMRKKEDFYLS
jgi:probable rRNA maturation factor